MMVKPFNANPADAAMASPRRTVNIAGSTKLNLEGMGFGYHHIRTPARDNNFLVLGNVAILFFHFKLNSRSSTDLAMGMMSPGSEVKREMK